MMQNSKFILLFLLLLSFFSCDTKQVFSVYTAIPQAKWHKENQIRYSFQVPDTTASYNLFLQLRNNQAYKYSNLYVIVQMDFPNGKALVDTLQYAMAKPNGSFLGTGFGEVKENKLWYKKDVRFPSKGICNVGISHAMRENGVIFGKQNLEGVVDVGFKIENTAK